MERTSVDLLNYFLRRVTAVEDAADLLADTFLVACRRAHHLPTDPEQGRMWLFVTARHVLANWRRGQARRNALADALRSQLAVEPLNSDNRVRATASIDVRDAVAGLLPDQQELIALVHWDGFTITEAASVLGIRESTARGRYQRAKSALRARLENYDDVSIRSKPLPEDAASVEPRPC